MIFQQINATDAEKVFVTMFNGEGATLPEGAVVIWDTATTQNGTFFRQPDTGCLHGICGALHVSVVSISTTPVLVQIYGYDDDVLSYATNFAYTAGAPLVPVAGSNCLSTAASGTTSSNDVVQQPIFGTPAVAVASSSVSSNANPIAVFIRCM